MNDGTFLRCVPFQPASRRLTSTSLLRLRPLGLGSSAQRSKWKDYSLLAVPMARTRTGLPGPREQGKKSTKETFINSSNFSFNPDPNQNDRDMGDKILIYLWLKFMPFSAAGCRLTGITHAAGYWSRCLPAETCGIRAPIAIFFTIYLKRAITCSIT